MRVARKRVGDDSLGIAIDDWQLASMLLCGISATPSDKRVKMDNNAQYVAAKAII